MDDNFIGFDVSKDFFDLAYLESKSQWFFKQFDYNSKGLTQMAKAIPINSICVMEATGPYYLRLANFLYEKGFKVCVVNPLVIRRYSQMLLKRTKTDKADAKLIAMYGKLHQPKFWEPSKVSIQRIRHINSVLESLIKNKTQWTNKIEAAKQDSNFDNLSMKMMKEMLTLIDRRINKLEEELNHIVEENYKEESIILKSIPGIGKRTSIMLIAITGGFTKFESYRQFSSYIGLCPRIYESGTSVKGKARICKIGLSRLRQLLYMCAMTAKESNKACKELFERLVEKGKSKKLALIAVANKLIKQAFGCIKNMSIYNAEFC
jgi:transposase